MVVVRARPPLRRTMIGTLLGLGVLLGAGGLAGCGSAPTAAPATTAVPAVVPSPDVAAAVPSPAAGPAGRVIRVDVAHGAVTGDTGRVRVERGSPVTLAVRSDVADQVHLHGYDREVDVPPGGTAILRFTADLPGVFEVELHRSEVRLLQLEVR